MEDEAQEILSSSPKKKYENSSTNLNSSDTTLRYDTTTNIGNNGMLFKLIIIV